MPFMLIIILGNYFRLNSDETLRQLKNTWEYFHIGNRKCIIAYKWLVYWYEINTDTKFCTILFSDYRFLVQLIFAFNVACFCYVPIFHFLQNSLFFVICFSFFFEWDFSLFLCLQFFAVPRYTSMAERLLTRDWVWNVHRNFVPLLHRNDFSSSQRVSVSASFSD